MTRVNHRAPAAQPSGSLNRVTKARKKKPYKILLESVTQEKKKLHSAISYDAHAPVGYSFVPAGTPDLTEYCKDLCRKRGLVAHIVSAKPKNKAHVNPEKIAHHVHRIGHHFPNEVVDQACDWLGYSYRGGTYQKNLDGIATSRLARSLATHGSRMGLHGRPGTVQETSQQIRAAIRDLFPKIPDEDLEAIVKHAFREGTKRVGNAQELPLPRRVQLAVVAHIRHEYTDYDRLLKVGSYVDARSKVEQASLDQLMKWRGEGDTGMPEMEETFREVIVLDDDEDEDNESENAESTADGREHSLEIISSQATAHELQANDLVDVEWIDAHSTHRMPGKTYFVRRAPRQIPLIQRHPRPVYQTMQPALRTVTDRRVENVHAISPNPKPHSRQISHPHRPEPRLQYRTEPAYERGRQLVANHPEAPTAIASEREQPPRFLESNGVLYELQSRPDTHSTAPTHSSMRPGVVEYNNPQRFPQPVSHSIPAPQYTRREVIPATYSSTGRSNEHVPLHDSPQKRYLRRAEHIIGEGDVVIPSIERDALEPENMPSLHALSIAQQPQANQAPAPASESIFSRPRTLYTEANPINNASDQPLAQYQHPHGSKRKSWPAPMSDYSSGTGSTLPKRQKSIQGNTTVHERLREASVGVPSRHTHAQLQYPRNVGVQSSEHSRIIDLTSSPQSPNNRRSDALFTSLQSAKHTLPISRTPVNPPSEYSSLHRSQYNTSDPYDKIRMQGMSLTSHGVERRGTLDRPPSAPGTGVGAPHPARNDDSSVHKQERYNLRNMNSGRHVQSNAPQPTKQHPRNGAQLTSRPDDQDPLPQSRYEPAHPFQRKQTNREPITISDSPEKKKSHTSARGQAKLHRTHSGDQHHGSGMLESRRIRRYGLPEQSKPNPIRAVASTDSYPRGIPLENQRQLYDYY